MTTFPPDPKCPAAPAAPLVALPLAMAEALTDLSLLATPVRPAGMTAAEWRDWNRILVLIDDAVRAAKGGAA